MKLLQTERFANIKLASVSNFLRQVTDTITRKKEASSSKVGLTICLSSEPVPWHNYSQHPAFISQPCPSLVTILLSYSKVIYNNGTAMNYKRKTLLLTQWLSLQFQSISLVVSTQPFNYSFTHSTIFLGSYCVPA